MFSCNPKDFEYMRINKKDEMGVIHLPIEKMQVICIEDLHKDWIHSGWLFMNDAKVYPLEHTSKYSTIACIIQSMHKETKILNGSPWYSSSAPYWYFTEQIYRFTNNIDSLPAKKQWFTLFCWPKHSFTILWSFCSRIIIQSYKYFEAVFFLRMPYYIYSNMHNGHKWKKKILRNESELMYIIQFSWKVAPLLFNWNASFSLSKAILIYIYQVRAPTLFVRTWNWINMQQQFFITTKKARTTILPVWG